MHTLYLSLKMQKIRKINVFSGAFYYTLGNIAPMYRSSHKVIQLLCLCKTSNIKKYGIDAVLRPFMADLQKLEQVNICTIGILSLILQL